MRKRISRFALGFVIILGAVFILLTTDKEFVSPFSIFHYGMIFSGVGTLLHWPLDSIDSSFNETPLPDRIGVMLLLGGGLIIMIAVLFKIVI